MRIGYYIAEVNGEFHRPIHPAGQLYKFERNDDQVKQDKRLIILYKHHTVRTMWRA